MVFGKDSVILASNGVPSDLEGVVSSLDNLAKGLQKLNVTANVTVNQVPVPSNYSMFLRIDGIFGGSTDPDHRGWIDVLSYSIGTYTLTSVGGAGRPVAEPFNITKPIDKATPIIAFSVNDGSHIRRVDLEIVNDESGVFMKYELEDVLIVSDRQNGNAFGQTQPLEETSFEYEKITWTYRAFGQPAITKSWDYGTQHGS